LLPADIVPVIEGQVYYPAARRLSYGGEDVTEYLRRLLQQQEDTAFREAPTSELHRLKEECIRIAESKEAALSEVHLQLGICTCTCRFSGPSANREPSKDNRPV
jgi:actin-related protein